MKRAMLMSTVLTITMILMTAVVTPTLLHGPVLAEAADMGTDSNPIGRPSVVIPPQYRPALSGPDYAAAETYTGVFFTPQDENTSATVLFLYNVTDVAKTVALQTFYLDGSPTLSTSLSVPAHGLVRICSDTVTTVSASWADYVLVNFTTFSTYGKLKLPSGVKAEGYVVYNPSGIYDPLTEAQMLPLRFSVKYNTVP